MPRTTLHPIDYEQVRNYLLDKKETQNKYHDQNHNVNPLPELISGQKVLFLSPKEENQYTEGTVSTKASTPRSYYVESKGKTYCHTCQHICTINTDIPVSQDHQLEHNSCLTRPPPESVPISQDHQQNHCHKNIPVSQDHHHNNVPVSQDHYHNNILFHKTIT